MNDLEPPVGLLAELTHRCPLRCPYCSNPLALVRRHDELDTATWQRVFEEAAELGVLHVHLSGGEPTAREDLEALVARAAAADLYTNLVTSGVLLETARVERLVEAGLDHVQLSLQASDADLADHIGGLEGGHLEKMAAARRIRDAGLPLTVNAVVHRQNLHQLDDLIALAVAMGAMRLEVNHVQYHGWAMENRAALLPTLAQLDEAAALIDARRRDLEGLLVIDCDAPGVRPGPCLSGWGQQLIYVTPSGNVLPCHAAETIEGMTFDNVRDRSLAEVWYTSEAFQRFRGTDWMPEPCRSCPEREVDWGGCRCHAYAVTGDAAQTDPACHLSPHHHLFEGHRADDAPPAPAFRYRSTACPSLEPILAPTEASCD